MKTLLGAVLLGSSMMGLVLGACTSSSDTPPSAPAGSDASATSNDAAPDVVTVNPATDGGGDAGSACNALVNAAPAATQASVKGNAPAATGGSITDGTYYLTAFTIYDPNGTDSPASPSGMKTTLSIKGNVMDSVVDVGDGEDQFYSETFSVSGTDLNRNLTCPKTAPDLAAVYSVSNTNLTIYETDGKGIVAGSVYVKQ